MILSIFFTARFRAGIFNKKSEKKKKQGWKDSNPQYTVPETAALPFGYTPVIGKSYL